jgi:hypothetical protein
MLLQRVDRAIGLTKAIAAANVILRVSPMHCKR